MGWFRRDTLTGIRSRMQNDSRPERWRYSYWSTVGGVKGSSAQLQMRHSRAGVAHTRYVIPGTLVWNAQAGTAMRTRMGTFVPMQHGRKLGEMEE
jgi:hypothetical protein